MIFINEVSSSVIKNTYRVFAKLLFNNDLTYGEKVMEMTGSPVLANGAQQTINQFAERALANAFFRNGADRRFEPGAARIAISECGWNPFDTDSDVDVLKISRLKRILEFISEKYNDRTIIDNYLNNKSLDELYASCSNELQKIKDEQDKELETHSFNSEHTYKIVRIDSFEESKKYHDLTNPDSRWCLTYSYSNYMSYTQKQHYAMYFCIRDDINEVKREIGENCPLDEYGKSLLCIIVDTEGNLATFTTRWNHKDANGNKVTADKGLGDKVTVSEIVGVNFNKVFKPYTEEEIKKIADATLSFDKLVESNEPGKQFTDYMDSICEYFEDKNADLDEDDDDHVDITDYNSLFDLSEKYGDETGDYGDIYKFDFESCLAFGKYAVIATFNGYYRLVDFHNKYLSNWCDAIIMTCNNTKVRSGYYKLFFTKEHGQNFYTVNSLTSEAPDISELNGHKIIKVVSALKNKYKTSSRFVLTLDDNSTVLVDIIDNKINVLQKVTVPNNYKLIQEIWQANIEPNNFVAVYILQNNETGKYNLGVSKNNFKPMLKLEEEGDIYIDSHYLDDYDIRRDTFCFKYNAKNDQPDQFLVIRLSNDLEHVEYITDGLTTELPIITKDSTDVITYNTELVYDSKYSWDKLYKCDVIICTNNCVHIKNIYTTRNMINSWFENVPAGKAQEYKLKPVGLYIKDIDTMEYVVFDKAGKTIYTDKLDDEYNPEEHDLRVTWGSGWGYKTCLFVGNKAKRSAIKQIELDEILNNIKSESTLLKYASFLC